MSAFLITNSNSKTFLLRLYPALLGDDRLQILNSLILSIPILCKSSTQMNLGKLIIEKISSQAEQEFIGHKSLSMLPLILCSSTCFGFLDSLVNKVKTPVYQSLYFEIIKNIDCMFERKVAYYFYKKLIQTIKDDEIISFTIDTIITLLDSMPYTQYGSLIIQTVLKTFELNQISKLLVAIKNKIIKFAVSKHSPRIIEAALDHGQDLFFDLFYTYIVKQTKIKFLLNTANGYYIIEKALEKCTNLKYLQDIKLQIINHQNDISCSLRSKFDKLLLINFKAGSQQIDDSMKFKAKSFNSKILQQFSNGMPSTPLPYSQIQSKINGQMIVNYHSNLKQSPESFEYYNNIPSYYMNHPHQFLPYSDDANYPQQVVYYAPASMHTSSNSYNINYNYIANADIQNSSVNSPCSENRPQLKKIRK